MIFFDKCEGRGFDPHCIFFDDEDLPKLIKVLERGLNTISPPEPYLDLIKLLEDMKK